MKKLPKGLAKQIIDAITDLNTDPRPAGSVKLSGGNCERRIRAGNDGIIYDVDDSVVTILVLRVRDRKDVYR